jgi:hypothetical protein
VKYLRLACVVLSAFGCGESELRVPVEFETTGQVDSWDVINTVYSAQFQGDVLIVEGLRWVNTSCGSLLATAVQKISDSRVVVTLNIRKHDMPDRCGGIPVPMTYRASIKYVRPVSPFGVKGWELHVGGHVIQLSPPN